MKHLLLLLLLAISSSVSGDAIIYECEIFGEHIHGANGELVSDKQLYIGGKFHVERRSGVVLGGGLDNSTYPTKQVLDPGGVNHAYKLIWISQDVVGTNGGKNVGYLQVKEFSEGVEKPFVLINGFRTLSGKCR